MSLLERASEAAWETAAESHDPELHLTLSALFERADEGWASYRHTSIGRLVAEVAEAYLAEDDADEETA